MGGERIGTKSDILGLDDQRIRNQDPTKWQGGKSTNLSSINNN